MKREERFIRADRLMKIGFAFNAFLMIIKLLAGHYGGSKAVFADGMESAADFVAILSSIIALKISRQGFDEKHPYGHGKAESLSALIVGAGIFLTGGWILYSAVSSLVSGDYPRPEFIALAAAAVTIVTKELLFRYTDVKGKELNSPAVTAVAKDHRKDAVTSVATLAGVAGGYAGIPFCDPLAAALTSVFIFKIGFETIFHAAHDLMDGQVKDSILDEITILAESFEGVEHVHEIKGRRSGQYVIIDLKLDMPPEMTVKASHDIITDLKRSVFAAFPTVGDVMIHINPHDDPDHEDLIRL